jgi:RimJ/RimL family protein N-acetyltransferase
VELGPLPIEAGGLRLRPWRADDLDFIEAVVQDPDVVRWTRVPSPYGRAEAEAFVAMATGELARGGDVHLCIERAEDGERLGSIGLRFGDEPGSGDVGYVVAPAARGRGVASAATEAICGWGFEHLGLVQVTLQTMVGNDASQRVARRAGFEEVGPVPGGCEQRGEQRDAVLFRRRRPA